MQLGSSESGCARASTAADAVNFIAAMVACDNAYAVVIIEISGPGAPHNEPRWINSA